MNVYYKFYLKPKFNKKALKIHDLCHKVINKFVLLLYNYES